jgi:hypothetical protein
VREAADDWSLPPHRLDMPTWRERVERGHRAGGHVSGVRWTRGLLGAAAVAIVAIVSLSFAVAWLTTPRGDQPSVGSSASPGGNASAVPSESGAPVVAASPMPKLVRNGDLPTPSRIMVQTGRGNQIADLATGELSPVLIEAGHGPTAVLARPGGGWVCVCGDGGNAISMYLQMIDADGVVGERKPLMDVVGTADPSEAGVMQPFLADVGVTASPDGRLALVGWIRRDGAAGWLIGVDVVDLETLARVASTQLLLDVPIVIDGRARLPFAPIARLSDVGDRILLTILASVDETGSGPGSWADHWVAPFDGRTIGTLASAPLATGDCLEFDAGLIGGEPPADGAIYYAACWSPSGSLLVKRIAADGRLVSATEFPGSTGGLDTGTMASPSGDAFFSWNPFDSVLSRLDLRSGELKVGDPQRPNTTGLTKPSGDLIVVSADGTRVYTLGIQSPAGGSSEDTTGVYAFDASTLAPLGHWAAQADYTSIAVSDDGGHVYAAADGQPGAAGGPGPEFGASITAYNTSDGSVAVIAGRLLARDLALGEAICR